MEQNNLQELARRLGAGLMQRGSQLALAESCTGGWIAKVVTDVAGSSEWFDRGFVTYSNSAKMDMLGVAEQTLRQYGAVSEPVVREMASGAVANSNADISVAVSGIAGPGGATTGKPVGTVWFAWQGPQGQIRAKRQWFDGDRDAVRRQAVAAALEGLLESLD